MGDGLLLLYQHFCFLFFSAFWLGMSFYNILFDSLYFKEIVKVLKLWDKTLCLRVLEGSLPLSLSLSLCKILYIIHIDNVIVDDSDIVDDADVVGEEERATLTTQYGVDITFINGVIDSIIFTISHYEGTLMWDMN